MTGYTTHSGPNQKFQEGWQRVFGKQATAGSRKTASTKPDKAGRQEVTKSRKSGK